jgi:hypothetical protein
MIEVSVSESDVENEAHVPDLVRRQVFQDRYEIQELIVVRVREPAAYRQCMLRVEDVGRWRIVDDDGVLEISSYLGKVLDVVALVVIAGLTEKTMVNHLVDVKLVQEGIAILQDQCQNSGKLRSRIAGSALNQGAIPSTRTL